MGSANGARAPWDVVEMDDAAMRRLVRACRAGVHGAALEARFGRSPSELRRMARAAGWDGTVTGRCEFAAPAGCASAPPWYADAARLGGLG